jgi:hypothetical protein
MRDPQGNLIGSFNFRQAPLGAGGFVTGLDFSSDGTRMIHWTDVWNGYIRDAGDDRWRLMLRMDNLSATEWEPKPSPGFSSAGEGISAARIAQSNKSLILATWNGFLYVTRNAGESYARVSTLGAHHWHSNGYAGGADAQRRFNRIIDIHPTNEDIWIVGTWGDGVHYTVDGGKTWASVAGLPTALNTISNTPGKYLVAFDPGAPENVYIHAFGTGLYRSTAGVTGAFALVEGGPATASNLVVTPAGMVYVCEFRTSNTPVVDALKRLERKGGTWTTIAGTSEADQVAVDPNNPSHLVIVNENGSFKRSADGGATWQGRGRYRGSGEIAWISNRSKPMYPAQLMFDPAVPGKLWVADGVGVSWTNTLGADTTWQWHDHSRGNEELVPTMACSSPGNPTILACWDKPFWRMNDVRGWTNMWSYPVPRGEALNDGTVTVGHSLDYAPEDPSFLVGTVGQGSNMDGYSTDGGRSWTQFVNKAPGFGGWVAVSTRDNYIITSTNNGAAHYTMDAGRTWNPIAFGGEDPVRYWASAYYVVRQNITADKTRPHVFAALVNNIVQGTGGTLGRNNAGVWLTKDGGATWMRKFSGCIQTHRGGGGSTTQFWQAKIEYVPGFSGELVYADFEGNAANRLWWSQDDGETWNDISPAIRQVSGFAFGKAAPGQTRPAIYFSAKVNGVTGIYVSFDWFATDPILMVTRPLDHIGRFNCASADLNVFGRVYVALATQGFAIGDYSKQLTLVSRTAAS